MKRTKRKSKSERSPTGVAKATQSPPDPKRLLAEVFFDLDGTLAENTWPLTTIGKPIERMVELLLQYNKDGFVCSIFTSRPSDHKDAIWDWLYLHHLDDLIYQVICDKPHYGLLIDDRSWNPWL